MPVENTTSPETLFPTEKERPLKIALRMAPSNMLYCRTFGQPLQRPRQIRAYDLDLGPALHERQHLPLGDGAAADHHARLALQVQGYGIVNVRH